MKYRFYTLRWYRRKSYRKQCIWTYREWFPDMQQESKRLPN